VAGFAFDTLMLRRIDEPKVIVQQAVYLVVSALLIGIELVGSTRELKAPRALGRVWKYREALLHFLMGTLLNCYTIFYFKSASALTSFAFIGTLVALLMMNEFKNFGKSQTRVHMHLLSLCLLSYAVALSPILWGSIGTLPFLTAILASLLLFWLYYRCLAHRLSAHPKLLRTHVAMPFGAIASLFVVLYFAGVIPPVPLSVTYMGIYHDVQKSEDGFKLGYTRGPFRFWQHGDQTFLARPGDSIYCFVQVFSPSHFKDQLQVRWFYRDERLGWQPQDAIPMPIVGGREEGYRGVTKKNNYQPGDWRVQIETRDNREIGWIGFRVERDDTTGERQLTTVVR
jgi:hypothetical protein